jgi:hypothetical protein
LLLFTICKLGKLGGINELLHPLSFSPGYPRKRFNILCDFVEAAKNKIAVYKDKTPYKMFFRI